MASQETNTSESGGGRDYLEWFRAGKESKVGFIDGNTFSNTPVEYSVIDGLAIFEGDIVLGTDEEVQARAEKPPPEGDRGLIIPGQRYRWPGGWVPYVTVPALRQRVGDAIAHWQQKTRIRFVERTAANATRYPDYVSFEERNGCWSYVGRQGGKQVISLAQGCGFGAAVHEIGHAVGLWHEQSREDRNDHVDILWDNNLPHQRHNFEQHITDGDDVGNYDFGSLMHYGPRAFSRNGQPTIVPKGGQMIGQRQGLSAGDVAAVRSMYPQCEPSRSWHGVQFRGTVAAGRKVRWVTHSWPFYWNVHWAVVPTGPVQNQSAQIEWKVQVERQAETLLKYYIEVTNVTPRSVTVEARYTVLGWSRWAR